MRLLRNWMVLLAVSFGVACDMRSDLAPVVDGNWRAANPNASYYRVRTGDTLYAIAFRYDQDYRRLAAINHLQSPYLVKVGQVIYLKSPSTPPIRTQRTVYVPTSTPVARSRQRHPMTPPVSRPAVVTGLPLHKHWLWPVSGKIVASFAPEQGKKGIDIAGKKGQTIRATADGTVAYAGDGLPGYGNLILIQHSKQLLSAYGYNARNLVRAGQTVHAGQAIGIVGVSPQRHYAMHFEVRKAGRPVNPRYFLR